MIENRNEYNTHLSQHQQDLNINFRRQNVFHSFLKKDVQVYQDSSQQSQMLEQMKIPLNIEDQIQIPDWLDTIYNDYSIPLKQAQYINIWDPVESHYIDITSSRSISSINFKQASPIYIRYLPYQENAVPPHANIHSMIEENYYGNSNYCNPLYQNNQQNNNNSHHHSHNQSNHSSYSNNLQNQQQQYVQTHSNNTKSSNAKSSTSFLGKNQSLNSQNFQRTNSDVTSGSSTSTISNNSSIRSKRQSVVEHSKNICNIPNNNNVYQNITNQNNSLHNDMSLTFDSSNNSRKLMDQLKQEASSSSPCHCDENILKNLKMEDQGTTFASTINNNYNNGSNSKSIQFNLKKEDTQEQNDNLQNSGEFNNNSNTANSASSSGKNSNGKPRHKDSDQLSQKDTSLTTQQSEQQIKNHKQLPREKRVKERQISYVKGKVDEWRNLYDNGRINSRGEIEKVNLDVAASLVGLSRKTLDDYYAQLRKAQKYCFDFDSNSSEKMGTLRKYVKKMSEKDTNAGDDDSIDTDNNTSSKSNFNTPQMKPSIPSDILKQELSMSVGHPSNSRKFSDNNLDLVHQSSIPLKHNLSAPPQQSLLNQIKIEHTNYSQTTINSISSSNNQPFSQQQKQLFSNKPQSILSQISYDPTPFKIENPNFEDKINDNSMNLEEAENINNNNSNNIMCNEEPMEEEDFTDYINSENNNNNPKEEQNDDQFI